MDMMNVNLIKQEHNANGLRIQYHGYDECEPHQAGTKLHKQTGFSQLESGGRQDGAR